MSEFVGFNSWLVGEKTVNKTIGAKSLETSELCGFGSQMIDSIWNDVLPARDTKSIWATTTPYTNDGKNLSLSVPGIPWPLSRQLDDDSEEHGAPDQLWDSSQDPPFEQDNGILSWRVKQTGKLPLPTCNVENCRSTSENLMVVSATSPIGTDPCGKITPSSCPVDDSTVPTLLSTEQLCEHLINTNDGWGKRPIDQSTPWELPEAFNAKPEPLGLDSGITTPTPGSQPNTASFVSGSRLVHPPPPPPQLPSNETLTGTGIWELHYETLSARSSLWSSSALSHPQVPTGSTPQPSMLMLDNSSSPPRSTTDPLINQSTPSALQRPSSSSMKWWDNGDRMWNVDDVTPATNRAHFGARGIVAGTNSIRQQDELNWYGVGVTPDCPLSSPFDCSSGANTWGDCYPATSPNAHWSPTTSVSPLMLPGPDDFRGQQLLNTASQTHANRMSSHPFNTNGATGNGNSYRTEMVKFLMTQGFKKEDVLAALIDNNMNAAHALYELRQRFPCNNAASRSQSTATNQQQLHHVVNNGNGGSGGSHLSSNSFGGPSSSGVAGNSHNKQVGANSGGYLSSSSVSVVPTQQSHAMSSIPVQPNPQMMRNQLIQQVRTALNLPPPNSMSGPPPTGNVGLTGTGGGNSLLGQPPPPVLNGTAPLGTGGGSMPPLLSGGGSHGGSGVSSATTGGGPPNRIVGNGSNNTAHHHNNSANHTIGSRVLNNTHHNAQTPPSYGSHSQQQHNKQRSPRQLSIINAIHELEKKLQDIQRQLAMYQGNSVMCAQPQYADVFTELQGQIHLINAQISAKQAQLSLVITQDAPSTPAGRSHHHHQQQQQQRPFNQSSHLDGNASMLNMNGFGQQSSTHTSLPPSCTSQGRTNQDQLVQQLMEMKLRSGNATNTGEGLMDAGDFPTIGMWSAQQSNRGGATLNDSSDCTAQDGNLLHDTKFFSSGPRSLTNARNGISKQPAMGNPGSSGWLSTSGQSQSINHQQRNTMANGNTSWHSMNMAGSGVSVEQQLNGGNGGLSGFKPHLNNLTGSGDNKQSVAPWLMVQPVNGLQNILGQFGLLQLHVLNPTTGTALIRLQSAEHALQLMRAVGNRVAVESLSHSQALAHLQQQRNAPSLRPDNFNQPPVSVMMDHGNGISSSWSNNSDRFVNNFNGTDSSNSNNDAAFFCGGAGSRKSFAPPHNNNNNASRHRMMVSGMHF